MEEQNRTSPSISIEKIKFNDGTTIEFHSDDIVLLVGANNVGKSRALKDLKDDLNNSNAPKVIVDEISYKSRNIYSSCLKAYFDKYISKNNNGDFQIFIEENLSHIISDSNLENISDEKVFYKALFSFLSTENRLIITKPISFPAYNYYQSLNIIRTLERDSKAIRHLNAVLNISFGKGIEVYEEYVDSSVVKKYKIGNNDIIDCISNTNQRDSYDVLSEMDDLHNQGDGIRSAVAILASLIVSDHSLFLIDEPETFMHPPQARLLGKNIVELSEKKQCFISTHSIDFIKGVLEADSKRVKIIKINRIENKNSFNLVDNDSISKIANDKILKYTNILDGLFYDRLVLCENESDCKFYSAILENLDAKIYQNTLFCAVGGKDQFKKVIPLLIKLNIHFIVIVDIDVINSSYNVKTLVNSLETGCYDQIKDIHVKFIEEYKKGVNPQVKTQATIKLEINQLFTNEQYISESVANKIKNVLKQSGSFKLLKYGGKGILPQGECVALFNEINGFLRKRNIYILECGEIERFVPDINGHGNAWVENTFAKYESIDDEVYDEAKRFIKTVFNIK